MESCYANGKLLLTGEYFVLKGAKALALPLKQGQRMKIHKTANKDKCIYWKTFVQNKHWFDCKIETPKLKILCASDQPTAEFLASLLRAARKLNPGFPEEGTFNVETHIDFNIEWGWGSSSSLITNVAEWAGVDPFDLHFEISEGSAYDIACAKASGPVLYQLKKDQPEIERISFDPVFKKNIFFIYLGKKQRSIAAVKAFRKVKNNGKKGIKKITALTEAIAQTETLNEFNLLVEEHERIVSAFLDIPSLKESRFTDFPGAIKSLGAWGGDFAMATWTGDEKGLKKYFFDKGLKTIFLFEDIVLQPDHG